MSWIYLLEWQWEIKVIIYRFRVLRCNGEQKFLMTCSRSVLLKEDRKKKKKKKKKKDTSSFKQCKVAADPGQVAYAGQDSSALF